MYEYLLLNLLKYSRSCRPSGSVLLSLGYLCHLCMTMVVVPWLPLCMTMVVSYCPTFNLRTLITLIHDFKLHSFIITAESSNINDKD